MPTPFMHLAFAKRLISDKTLPGSAHALLEASWGAFLLGSIAPDARVSSGLERSQTHFFEYLPKIDPPPVDVMLTRHAELKRSAIADDLRKRGHSEDDVHKVMGENFMRVFAEVERVARSAK